MSSLYIENPEWLWLLWLLPLLIAFQIYVFQQKSAGLEQFFGSALAAKLTGGLSLKHQRFKAVLVLVAIGALMLSLAGIKVGYRWQELNRHGVDIVLAFDLSKSMLVQDATTSASLTRLDRAKRKVLDLLRSLDGDRIGLVAFAGTAYLECPLTFDYDAAALFLSELNPDDMPVPGTDLAAAIDTALTAFDADNDQSRAILLITDGEDHSGQAQAAAQRAKEAKVPIYVIGIGQPEGAPIPTEDGGLQRDRGGELILSRLDEVALQKIAVLTGGRYVRSVTADLDLEEIYTQGIRSRPQSRDTEGQKRKDWHDRFQWLLALAIFSLALEPFIIQGGRGELSHE